MQKSLACMQFANQPVKTGKSAGFRNIENSVQDSFSNTRRGFFDIFYWKVQVKINN